MVKKYLGYEAIGMLAFGISLVASFSILSDFGITTTHQKKYNEKDFESGKSIFTYSIMKFSLNFFMLTVVFLSYYFYKSVST